MITVKLQETDDRVVDLQVIDKHGVEYHVSLEFQNHEFEEDIVQVCITKPIFKDRERNPLCHGCNVPNWIYWMGLIPSVRNRHINHGTYRMGPGIGPGIFFGFTAGGTGLEPSTNEKPVQPLPDFVEDEDTEKEPDLALEVEKLKQERERLIAEWSIMARACGNWREWPGQAVSDHDHPDWLAAARAILERDEQKKGNK